MSNTFRLGTFNAENLFARYKFRTTYKPSQSNGFSVNDVAFNHYANNEKKLTAQAIKKVNADILCLQEVESLKVLDNFNSKYLGRKGYRHRLLIDCFDPRHIDVAILSRFPILSVTSHRDDLSQIRRGKKLFSRDCLEVQVEIPVNRGKKTVFHLYINHFKSMMGGRKRTAAKRKEQADRVKAIVDQHWKNKGYRGNFAILGDFNDYDDGLTSLNSLLRHQNLVDVLRNSSLAQAARWTHYYKRKKQYTQLDYLMLSKPLYNQACEKLGVKLLPPGLMLQGLPQRAERYTGPRFKDVGMDKPKASDHVPLYVDVPKDALF